MYFLYGWNGMREFNESGRMCENIGSGQVENFSRNRAAFPKVSRNPRKSTFPRLSGFLRILKLYRLEYTEETITKYVMDIMLYYKIYFIISNFIILGNPGNLELQDTFRSRSDSTWSLHNPPRVSSFRHFQILARIWWK